LGSPKPPIGNQVRHILIILSLLLLSSPVIGQETGVLYYWERSSGQVWKTFRDKDTQPKYKGQVENGKPNGQGTYTNPDGEKYVGEWKDGEKHGQGTYTWSDGRKYVGEYKDDKKHGHGTFIWSNGDKYVGEYKDGEENSQGTYTWSNGDKYVGLPEKITIL